MNLADPELAGRLQDGAVGVIPTDTQYGIVAQAGNPAAAGRLYAAKRRKDRPGTVIAAETAQLAALGLKERYLKPVAHFWPGAISIVIPTGPVLGHLHLGRYSLAVRIPDHPELIGLLRRTGPLLTTSANLPGQPPAGTVAEARAAFGETLDFYVDGGDLAGRPPSTIIRIVDDAVEVLREGAVQINEAGVITP